MDAKILDFVAKRKAKIEKNRRRFERLVFHNFLGAYSVIQKTDSIVPITLVDIAHDGCSFQTSWSGVESDIFTIGSELTLRMYFSPDSYIPVVVDIKNSRPHKGKDGERYVLYGCKFDKSMPSFVAMESFIDFLYRFAEHSSDCKDNKRVGHI